AVRMSGCPSRPARGGRRCRGSEQDAQGEEAASGGAGRIDMTPTDQTAARETGPAADVAAVGRAQIDWVRRHSPVLDGFVRRTLSDGALEGVRVAVVVHLEAKTAFLATVLADAGAEVIAAGS